MISPPDTSSSAHLYVEWTDYHACIEQLARRIHDSGWRFDQVLCLARGGLRPGDVLSRLFDCPLAILSASSYTGAGGVEQGQLTIAAELTAMKPLAGKVLLVDDLVDSGVTLGQVKKYLTEKYPDVTEVRTAVLWWKACSVVQPDYFVRYLPDNPWIHQPFERYDSLTASQLNVLSDEATPSSNPSSNS